MRAGSGPTGLERLVAPLSSIPLVESSGQDREPSEGTITCHVGSEGTVWLSDGSWRLYARASRVDGRGAGVDLAAFTLSDGAVVRARVDADRRAVSIPFSLSEAYDNYVSEAWTESARTRGLKPGVLDAFYRVKPLVPRGLQLVARRALMRRQRGADFPAWPWDESVLRLLGLYLRSALAVSGRDALPFRWFWPSGRSAALTLGHDVETAEGLRLAVELADVEEELGFRSSFNLGSWYEPDEGIVRELTERGFEIGLHGVQHDRALFASRAEFERQRPLLAEFADRIGAEGFRSPATYRVFEWLAELPVGYDASISHSDPFEAQPGGCCSIWPFFNGPVVELPYTLPQDHTLLTLLKARSVDLWIDQAERIERHHGLIHCVSHPDRGYLGDPRKRALYAEFLRAMADRTELWQALPRDVARWWRLRDRSVGVEGPVVQGVARAGGGPGDVVFEPARAVVAQSDPPDIAASLEQAYAAPRDERVARVASP